MTDIARVARLALVSSASALSFIVAGSAMAQSIPPKGGETPTAQGTASGTSGGTGVGAAAPADENGIEEIVVTAQRQAESLQDVPVAVSAFTSEALERQQIKNSSDLQLTLPNITYTKTNFTSSSFTIRGVGDLCVGVTCDNATAIHINDMPLISTRLFETEFFDLERIEVLRGPQGTLFGRNATSGVLNFITAKPDLRAVHAAAEAEYGNYDSLKLKGMINVPLSDTFGVRIAGTKLSRDGYTKNLFNNTRIDGRDSYAVRGSVRWEPTETTRVDLMGYYFHENDDRLRIQKQLCDRDPTGVLGCLPSGKGFGVTNGNASFVGVLTSQELLRIKAGATLGPIFQPLGLGSIYGADPYAGQVNPADMRTVNTDYTPRYHTTETQYEGRIEQDIGQYKLTLSGLYQRSGVDSQQDYNLSVQNSAIYLPGLNYLTAISGPTGVPGFPLSALLAPVRQALIPNGPNGPYCTSLSEMTGTGVYGGHSFCSTTPQDFDRSEQKSRSYSGEAILESQLDGPFNFLLGGIYNDYKLSENSYFVNAFGIDYLSGVLGVLTSIGQILTPPGNPAFPNSYLGTPFYRNNTDSYTLKSYGLFGEAYYNFNDKLKITAGLRYNDDKKAVSARTTLASFLVPFGSANAFASPFVGQYDADPGVTGNQLFATRKVSFSEYTGRAVLDYKITDDNLVYLSYSRGYKSGGINPPLSPGFAVPESFKPEFIDSFEIGSKNSFMGNTLQLNLTGFYYKYKALQLSRIVNKTAVNDNVDADIYGVEAEAVARPIGGLMINASASYLHTKVSSDKFLGNPRDPSGGRTDSVIIKDITDGHNCTVVPNVAGNAALANGFVTQVNTGIGASVGSPTLLRAPVAFPAGSGVGSTGAFSICSQLAAFATATGAAVSILDSGVAVNIKGNRLPQAPDYKLSAGAQYTFDFGNGMSLVPRADVAYTGKSYGLIFNQPIDRIKAYTVVNAQVQLNGMDDRWFLKAYVQNITKNDAITGLGVGDQSSGLFTNVFTLEPRRYGIAGGVKF